MLTGTRPGEVYMTPTVSGHFRGKHLFYQTATALCCALTSVLLHLGLLETGVGDTIDIAPELRYRRAWYQYRFCEISSISIGINIH